MKYLYSIIFLLFSFTVNAQRFDWVSFTPTVTGNGNGASGGQAIALDDEGYLYTVSYFTVPMIIGPASVRSVSQNPHREYVNSIHRLWFRPESCMISLILVIIDTNKTATYKLADIPKTYRKPEFYIIIMKTAAQL